MPSKFLNYGSNYGYGVLNNFDICRNAVTVKKITAITAITAYGISRN